MGFNLPDLSAARLQALLIKERAQIVPHPRVAHFSPRARYQVSADCRIQDYLTVNDQQQYETSYVVQNIKLQTKLELSQLDAIVFNFGREGATALEIQRKLQKYTREARILKPAIERSFKRLIRAGVLEAVA
jgi:hypothetical protein